MLGCSGSNCCSLEDTKRAVTSRKESQRATSPVPPKEVTLFVERRPDGLREHEAVEVPFVSSCEMVLVIGTRCDAAVRLSASAG